ncbi:MAG: patatin [Candidatus Nephthysia bennettiae]|uniref:Patatin-like phospholipase family protein n=1 Tax=Candidatus Nephthysia bennettiae TaxID=3127016 RepID=A0A934K818_9BACT|nr:patatin-like phospholipase family protein [Candidatus Dormibacteraeota bacterium]MBJ7610694.1 patatin-like phospholipase family protein [Candidatus Dormibacteraeota bacterium]PZR99478.1 MAG: patatin [Candidatus Dormibacteraeota bacterium]
MPTDGSETRIRGVGLVLSGGGTVGHAFHSGVLAAIAEATGWDARTAGLAVGTSAGSLVAAMLRAGFPAPDLAARVLGRPLSEEGRRVAELLRELKDLPAWSAARPRRGMAAPQLLRRGLLRPGSVRLAALVAAALPPGRVSAAPLGDAVRRLFGSGWPQQPTWICAVALDDGRRVVFGREGAPPPALADAVAASCAIPSYFEPVTIGGRRYVDGGVHSVTNLDVVAGLGLDLVLVSSAMSGASGSLRGSVDLPVRAASRARLAREAAAVRRAGTEVVIFQPGAADLAAMGINLMDAGRSRAVVTQALESTRQRLKRDDLRARLRQFIEG